MATTQPGAAAGRLLELAVTDLALIDRLRLELAPGLNVLTGETGAGKSLLIDALGLAADPAALAVVEPLTTDQDPQVAIAAERAVSCLRQIPRR